MASVIPSLGGIVCPSWSWSWSDYDNDHDNDNDQDLDIFPAAARLHPLSDGIIPMSASP